MKYTGCFISTSTSFRECSLTKTSDSYLRSTIPFFKITFLQANNEEAGRSHSANPVPFICYRYEGVKCFNLILILFELFRMLFKKNNDTIIHLESSRHDYSNVFTYVMD